jgi:hypothetical protein
MKRIFSIAASQGPLAASDNADTLLNNDKSGWMQ